MSADTPSSDPNAVRVMIVDDSAVIRGLYRKMIGEETGMEIVTDASNGQMAIDRVARTDVDVVVMDIEMPVLDGVSAIPGMLKAKPDIQIIMSSTLTERNAEIALKALEAGARDYIQKPTSKGDVARDGAFRNELCNKIRNLGKLRMQRSTRASNQSASAAPAPQKDEGWRRHSSRGEGAVKIELRSPGHGKPSVLVVGSSTGGPQALQTFFKGVDKSIGIPILVVQHMPAKFTTILCGHIERATGWPCREAVEGDVPTAGQILLAPGGFHMVVNGTGAARKISLNEDPPENFCRPAVDPLFRTAAASFGGNVLGVVLTGMGNDGTKGGRAIVDNGGTIIAQDEETSVVWGMPGSVAAAGLCSAVLPLDELPAKTFKLARGMAA
ncbi:MAG: chemotaxis response regulator protein-glutamate methylesterase [Rhodospirillales bacterium]